MTESMRTSASVGEILDAREGPLVVSTGIMHTRLSRPIPPRDGNGCGIAIVMMVPIFVVILPDGPAAIIASCILRLSDVSRKTAKCALPMPSQVMG